MFFVLAWTEHNDTQKRSLSTCISSSSHVCWKSLNILSINTLLYTPAPMAHSYQLGLVIWRQQVRILVGLDICHLGCVYTILQTVQRHGVYSDVYDTAHYEKPLKSFKERVGHSPGFWLPSVAILPHCAESDEKQYSLLHYYTHRRELSLPLFRCSHGNGAWFFIVCCVYISVITTLLRTQKGAVSTFNSPFARERDIIIYSSLDVCWESSRNCIM